VKSGPARLEVLLVDIDFWMRQQGLDPINIIGGNGLMQQGPSVVVLAVDILRHGGCIQSGMRVGLVGMRVVVQGRLSLSMVCRH